MINKKKIHFDIKYKSQIENGTYSVETRDGRPVKIVEWCINFGNMENCILGTYDDRKTYNCWHATGNYNLSGDTNNLDLFVVTDEKEYTPFQEYMKRLIEAYATTKGHLFDLRDDSLDKMCGKIKELVKEEMLSEGYVFAKCDPDEITMMGCPDIELTESAEELGGFVLGLTGLKWRRCYGDPAKYFHIGGIHFDELIKDGYYIKLNDLEKFIPKEK